MVVEAAALLPSEDTPDVGPLTGLDREMRYRNMVSLRVRPSP